MTSPTDINDELLINLAGKGAFQRGLTYYQTGNVLNWSRTGATITADVAGTDNYRVRLTHRTGYLEGSCNCPAFERNGFCKHCVAVALAYRSGGPQHTQPNKLESHKRPKTKANSTATLDPKTLKKRITAALPYNRHLFRYEQVHSYFANAELVFDQLEELAAELPTETALGLVNYGLQRLARALLTIDDSGGFRLNLEQTLQHLHVQLMSRVNWPPGKMAAYLLELRSGTARDFYPAIPESYTLDSAVIEHYYGLLQVRWDKLPALKPNATIEQKYDYLGLQLPLMRRAQSQQDLDAQIALLQKTATEEYDFLELSRLCMDHDAWDKAEFWLAKARKNTSHKHYRNYRHDLERLQIRLHLYKHELSAALSLQWQIFTDSPNIGDYHELLKLNENNTQDEDYSAKAKDYLRSHLDNGDKAEPNSYVNTLIDIHLHENELPAAVQLCEERILPIHKILAVARRLGKQPATAIPLYKQVISSTVQLGNNKAYHDAIALLQELADTLIISAHHQAFATLLQELRAQHQQKRNFIKWLNEAFP